MNISRRSFLGYCAASATALGFSQLELFKLREALAKSDAPKVVWLGGSGCSGCSISFLNLVGDTLLASANTPTATVPTSPASLLKDNIDLVYHPVLMFAAGETAVAAAYEAKSAKYILVVEGGVPTLFNGATGFAWTYKGKEVTIKDAVVDFSAKAAAIVAVGSCAAFGGVSAAGPNPGGVVPVSKAVSQSVINVPGCPTHPSWLVWTLAKLLINEPIALDGKGRPAQLYGGNQRIHDNCPRLNSGYASGYGVDQRCLLMRGCNGPKTYSPCPSTKWNNGVNWCVDANSPCLGCTEPTFPNAGDFYNVNS